MSHFERGQALRTRLREAYAGILGTSTNDVAGVVGSTSDGMARVLSALGLRAGQEVITSDAEQPRVARSTGRRPPRSSASASARLPLADGSPTPSDRTRRSSPAPTSAGCAVTSPRPRWPRSTCRSSSTAPRARARSPSTSASSGARSTRPRARSGCAGRSARGCSTSRPSGKSADAARIDLHEPRGAQRRARRAPARGRARLRHGL